MDTAQLCWADILCNGKLNFLLEPAQSSGTDWPTSSGQGALFWTESPPEGSQSLPAYPDYGMVALRYDSVPFEEHLALKECCRKLCVSPSIILQLDIL